MAIKVEEIVLSSELRQSSDSSSDDDSSFQSVAAMPAPRRENCTLRGPGVIGKERFDAFCVFANKMLLDRGHIISIKDMVTLYGAYPIEFYIYQLNPSTVNKTSKMEFGENFTKTYLKGYLPTRNISISVKVSCAEKERRYKVLMKLDLGKKKKAIITTGWYKIVKHFKLRAGEVVSFHFYECRAGHLHPCIKHL